MGVIKDYNYKTEMHKLWKRFISENLKVPRKQMQVLCLPGYYAREVENVYYKLGVPPENIIGVEEDNEAYENLRKSQNFHTANMDILDYVKRTNKKFHAISLDFTGYLTDKERELLSTIGERGLLEKRCVLLTNFSGRRESKKQQEKYQERIALTELNTRLRNSVSASHLFGGYDNLLKNNGSSPTSFKDIIEVFSKKDLENLVKNGLTEELIAKRAEKGLVIVAPGLIDEANPEDLAKLIENGAIISDSEGNTAVKLPTDKEAMRDIGIPQDVFYSLMDYSFQSIKDSKLIYGFLDFYDPKLLEETIKERGFLSVNRELLDFTFPMKYPMSDRDKINVSEKSKRKFVEKYGDNAIFQRMFEWLCFKSFKWHPSVTHLARLYESGVFVPQKIDLYRYISDDGTPMNCDFWSFESIKKAIPHIKRYVDNFYKFPVGWAVLEEVQKHVRTSKRGLKDMREFIEVITRGLNPYEGLISSSVLDVIMDHPKRHEKIAHKINSQLNLLETGENERVFFGSFYKPRAKYIEIAKMLIRGKTDEEIREKYRIEIMELAGVKAALKRGSYEDLRIQLEEEMVEKKVKESKLEEKVKPVQVQKKAEEKKNHERYLLIPHKNYENLSEENKISENKKLRMKYFRQETKHLSDNRKKQLYDSIIESGWFNDLKKNNISDLKIYAFFDDLMLNFVHRKGRINSEKIRSLWDCIRGSDKLYEITLVYEPKATKQIKERKTKMPKLSEEQNQEIYDFIKTGVPKEEVMETYGLSAREYGARKAWVTMREQEKPEETAQEISEQENQEIYKDIIDGMPDEEIMRKYNIPKTKLAGQKMVLTKRGIKWKK